MCDDNHDNLNNKIFHNDILNMLVKFIWNALYVHILRELYCSILEKYACISWLQSLLKNSSRYANILACSHTFVTSMGRVFLDLQLARLVAFFIN